MKRLLTLAFLAAFSLGAQAAGAPDTLGRIKASKSITLAYAPNSAPFSFEDGATKKPVGYSIDLCEKVVASIQKDLGLAEIKVKWVSGGTPERLAMVAEGRADMECGVTTVTLKRQEKVDFGNVTFVQAGSVLARADAGIRSPRDLGGKKLAVVAGTTTERRVIEALGQDRIMAEVVRFKDRAEAFKAMEEGKVHALAGDKIVLVGLVARDTTGNRFTMLSDDFSVEPYAFALRRGDPDFRLAVNRGLARTYGGGDIVAIFERWFSPLKPSELIKALYLFGAMEE